MTDTAPAPRLIRRYPNRKLYDVQTSTYVALEDLAGLVRAGEELRVVDTGTGDDITAQTLTQVILDEGKRGPSLLPTELLHSALRRSGRALDAGRGAVTGAVAGAVGGAVESAVGAVGTLRDGVDGLLHQGLGKLSRVLPGPRGDELDALRRQVEDMERTLAALVARQPATPAAPEVTPASPDPAVSTSTPTDEDLSR